MESGPRAPVVSLRLRADTACRRAEAWLWLISVARARADAVAHMPLFLQAGKTGTPGTATQEFDDGANTGLAGRVLAQCAAGRAPADCVQCLQDSARSMPRCCWNTRGLGESVAVVLSDDCVLQFTMHLAYLRRQALVELSVRLSSVPLEQQR
uniref:Gnk2-homologous domain-containing protein n=1 Tax=Oryza glumipatula TaxID=40148 RepID=A0A0D9YFN7_9ORYZ